MTPSPPLQESNRVAYILPLENISETDRRLIRAYLRHKMNYTKAAESENTTRQRVARVWRRWESAIIEAI